MRTVQIIQFTDTSNEDFGHTPSLNKIYRVNEMEDFFYHEYEDDEDEWHEDEYPAINIATSSSGDHQGITRRISRLVINDDNTQYNLLTIVLDEDCQLFK